MRSRLDIDGFNPVGLPAVDLLCPILLLGTSLQTLFVRKGLRNGCRGLRTLLFFDAIGDLRFIKFLAVGERIAPFADRQPPRVPPEK